MSELMNEEEHVDTTARMEIHPGRGTAQSLQIYLCADTKPLGVLTFGNDTIRWSTGELTSIEYTPAELADILEEHERRRRGETIGC